MTSSELLARLNTDAEGGPLDRLAELCLDVVLEQPMSSVLPRDTVVRALRSGLEGWLSSPQAIPALERLVNEACEALQNNRSTFRELASPELQATLRELLGRPWSPDKQLVLTLIDRPPVRELVRGLLLQTVLDFARRASAPMAGMARGLGSLARMAADTAKSRSGSLGALVGAVSGEVERQVEKRAVEVVDAALGGVFGEIADAISNPRRAAEAVELRLAMFDGALRLTPPQLARELLNLDVPGGAEVLRDGLRRWLETPAADAALHRTVDELSKKEGARLVREVLEEAGQLQTVRTFGKSALRARMGEVVNSEAFAGWLAELADP